MSEPIVEAVSGAAAPGVAPVPGRGLVPAAGPGRLRLLSYNIQAASEVSRYRHYVTRSWHQVMPTAARLDNLELIAALVRPFDIVGLQEIDSGSLRTAFVDQSEYLAQRADFAFRYQQTNRRFGQVVKQCNALLSRFRPAALRSYRLPGRIPGRGAILGRFGAGDDALVVMIVHLALGRRARLEQLAFLAERIADFRHLILMGDFNCHSRSMEMDFLLRRTDLREPVHDLHTFPSWRPQRNIDHILVTPTLDVEHAEVLNHPLSDHLPIAMQVRLPAQIALAA